MYHWKENIIVKSEGWERTKIGKCVGIILKRLSEKSVTENTWVNQNSLFKRKGNEWCQCEESWNIQCFIKAKKKNTRKLSL